MRTFFGAVTETHDLGVVAEHCPHCDSLRRCLLRTLTQGNYVCFVKIAEQLRESSCMCTECLKPFPGKPHWSYAEVVPMRDGRNMDLDELLQRTNPILADRIRFKEQIRELGGDERFAVAYDSVEGMRPGWLRANLLKTLFEWPRLSVAQQNELEENIGGLTRAWQFARHMAVGFPTSSGSLAYFMSVPIFGLIVISMLVTRHWMWGGVALAASVIVATLIESNLFKHSVSRWVRTALIPEAQEVNIPLDRFVAVVDDIPGSKLGLNEELWPMKHHLKDIRAALIAEGKLQPVATDQGR